MKTAYQDIYLMDSDLKAAGPPPASSSAMYNVQTAYEANNLFDLKAAGPPPAYGSEMYIV